MPLSCEKTVFFSGNNTFDQRSGANLIFFCCILLQISCFFLFLYTTTIINIVSAKGAKIIIVLEKIIHEIKLLRILRKTW